LLNSISTFKFIVCLELLTPVVKTVNNVSEALQSSSSDILAALTAELSRLRSDDSYAAAFATAEALAQQLDIDCTELPVERQCKLQRRLDDNPLSAATTLSSSDQLKLSLHFSVLDRLLSELKERFLLS